MRAAVKKSMQSCSNLGQDTNPGGKRSLMHPSECGR